MEAVEHTVLLACGWRTKWVWMGSPHGAERLSGPPPEALAPTFPGAQARALLGYALLHIGAVGADAQERLLQAAMVADVS